MINKHACRYCTHCKEGGRQQTQRGEQGRRTFYCQHPNWVETQKEMFADGNFPYHSPLPYNFIGFGLHASKHNIDQLKKKLDKQEDISFADYHKPMHELKQGVLAMKTHPKWCPRIKEN